MKNKLYFLAFILIALFVFTGCTKELPEGVGPYVSDVVVDHTVKSYTITFKDADDSVILEKKVKEGAIPYCKTPADTGNDDVKTVFTGWSPALTTATEDKVYTATYQVVHYYTITFINDDDLEISSSKVAENTIPVAPTATKEPTNTTVYNFSSWDSELELVTGEKTYKATYTEATRYYNISYVLEDGTQIGSQSLEYEAMPTFENYNKPADAKYTYSFNGWDKEFVAVTEDTTYVCKQNAVINKYTVTWLDAKGNELKVDQNVEYGSKPDSYSAYLAYNVEAGKEIQKWMIGDADLNSDYVVTGDVTLKAVLTEEDSRIIFKVEGNDPTAVEEVHYSIGDTTIQAPAVPSKKGYVGSWTSYDLSTGRTQIVVAQYTPKQYEITIGESNYTVTYDQAYEFDTPTNENIYYQFRNFECDGIQFAASGIWTYDEEVSLTPVWDAKWSFERTNFASDAYRCEERNPDNEAQLLYNIRRYNTHQNIYKNVDPAYISDGEVSMRIGNIDNWNAFMFEDAMMNYLASVFALDGVTELVFDVYSKGINSKIYWTTVTNAWQEGFNNAVGGFEIKMDQWTLGRMTKAQYLLLKAAYDKGGIGAAGFILDFRTEMSSIAMKFDNLQNTAVYFDNFRVLYAKDALITETFDTSVSTKVTSICKSNDWKAGSSQYAVSSIVSTVVDPTNENNNCLKVVTRNHDVGIVGYNYDDLVYIFTQTDAKSISFDFMFETLANPTEGFDIRFYKNGAPVNYNTAGYSYVFDASKANTWITFTITKEMFEESSSYFTRNSYAGLFFVRYEETFYLDNFRVNF